MLLTTICKWLRFPHLGIAPSTVMIRLFANITYQWYPTQWPKQQKHNQTCNPCKDTGKGSNSCPGIHDFAIGTWCQKDWMSIKGGSVDIMCIRASRWCWNVCDSCAGCSICELWLVGHNFCINWNGHRQQPFLHHARWRCTGMDMFGTRVLSSRCYTRFVSKESHTLKNDNCSFLVNRGACIAVRWMFRTLCLVCCLKIDWSRQ